MSQALDLLKNILKEAEDIYLRVAVDEIKPEHNLIDDLGLDSLGRVSIFHEISFELDKEIPEEKGVKWQTVKDVLDLIDEYEN